MRGYQDNEARLISEVHSRKMRNSGPKLKQEILSSYNEKFLL